MHYDLRLQPNHIKYFIWVKQSARGAVQQTAFISNITEIILDDIQLSRTKCKLREPVAVSVFFCDAMSRTASRDRARQTTRWRLSITKPPPSFLTYTPYHDTSQKHSHCSQYACHRLFHYSTLLWAVVNYSTSN